MAASMNEEDRQAYLAGVHIGVLSIPRDGRGPLSAPIWYDYSPGGEVTVITSPESRKGRLLSEGTRVSLVAQDEEVPYRYVTIEGPVTSVRPSNPESLRSMAVRYLGDEGGDSYAAGSDGGGVIVAIRPEQWFSYDYGAPSA